MDAVPEAEADGAGLAAAVVVAAATVDVAGGAGVDVAVPSPPPQAMATKVAPAMSVVTSAMDALRDTATFDLQSFAARVPPRAMRRQRPHGSGAVPGDRRKRR